MHNKTSKNSVWKPLQDGQKRPCRCHKWTWARQAGNEFLELQPPPLQVQLGRWWNSPTHLKNMRIAAEVKLDHESPSTRGENFQNIWNHHLEMGFPSKDSTHFQPFLGQPIFPLGGGYCHSKPSPLTSISVDAELPVACSVRQFGHQARPLNTRRILGRRWKWMPK